MTREAIKIMPLVLTDPTGLSLAIPQIGESQFLMFITIPILPQCAGYENHEKGGLYIRPHFSFLTYSYIPTMICGTPIVVRLI